MASNLYVCAWRGADPLAGVFCALYSAGGALLQTDTTDGVGEAFLGSRAAGTYEIRLTAPAGSVLTSGTRQSVVVAADDPADLAVDVSLTLNTIATPADPTICRCAGSFVDPAGRPFADAVLTFSEKTLPQLTYASSTNTTTGVLPRPITCRLDSRGYGTVDLIRGAEYAVMVGPLSNTMLEVVVPDTATAPLPDVLFPLVDRVEYTSEGGLLTPAAPTLAMQVGEIVTLALETVYRSGYRVVGLSRVTLTNLDSSLVSMQLTSGNELVITALAIGEVVIQAARNAETPSVTPVPTIKGSLTVTVSG